MTDNETSSSTSDFSQTLNQLNTNLPSLAKTLNIQQVKLDRTNYLIWKTQIIQTIQALDLEEFIM